MRVCIVFICWVLFTGCSQEDLSIVTVKQFADFVEETGYVTDAERFKWSFEQIDVDSFRVVNNATWRNAYDENLDTDMYPVIQVSYNDALAYTKWSHTILPEYNEYWELAGRKDGRINRGTTQILPLDACHVIGNTWEITKTIEKGQVRLAGGSYLCNTNTCNGTSRNRALYIDAYTGNSHIGFAVIKK